MNNRLYALHGRLGLNFGLLLFMICLSGTFAVVSHEIDWLCNPAIRVTPSDDSASCSEMFAAAENDSDTKISSGFAPLGTYFAAEFWTKDTRGIYVSPYTGQVTGEAMWMNSQRFFRYFHRQFYVYSFWGLWLVAVFGIVLLISSAGGLLFYKRW